MKRIVSGLFASVLIVMSACSGSNHTKERASSLQDELESYIDSQEAKIGMAVIIDNKDTISVNGDQAYQMMSVFKFPLALALADKLDNANRSVEDSISISAEELLEGTYSPMLDKYGKKDIKLPISEVLDWSLTQSDNNAADIIINRLGGKEEIPGILRKLGIPSDIKIGASEEDMYRDQNLSALNTSTPLAMAELFNRFNSEIKDSSPSYTKIASLMENCQTGTDRLAASLPDEVVIGHKTGTGFSTPTGGVSAINDCGYVNLPDGHHYSLAVFVTDSPKDPALTATIIAHISKMVYDYIKEEGR